MKVYSPSIIEELQVSGSATISGSLEVTGTISASAFSGNIETATTASYVELSNVDGFTDYSSSVGGRFDDLENFSSSLDATFATDAELEAATSSIISNFNDYTSSTDDRLDDLETESGSIRTDFSNYTSSADNRLDNLENESGSIRTELNNYTSSTDLRLDSLEVESGSIRTAFNNYTSSTDSRLDSIEIESGSIRTTLNNYTSSADSRLSSIETESGSIRTTLNNYTSSANLRLDSLEVESGSIRTAFNNFTGSNSVVSSSIQIDHDATTNYVSNQHIDHSNVNITAGSGISGGGDITLSRTLTLDTGSAHFTSGVKTKLNSDLVVSGSDIQVKTFLSLNNVDNTSDVDKPLSTAQKAYVDEVAQGLKARSSARVLVDSNLNATYNNGTNGSGSFLEANSNGAFPTTDGIDTAELNVVNVRILVIGQTNKAHNGLYVVQTPGNGSTPWKIRRCSECDSSQEIPGSFIFVKAGTVYGNTGWVLLVDNPATFIIGTDNINATQFSGAGSFLAGNGLDLDGNVFSLDTGSVHFTGGVKAKLSADMVVSGSGQVDHNATTNYVANQHIDHTTVSISPGAGMSGGGTIAANRTLTLDTGSAHFTGGVKAKLNTDGVVSGSGQIAINSTTGTLNVDKGGTGQTTYTNGQLLIGNTTGNTLTKATLTAGTGITVTNGTGSITIAAINNGTVTSVGGTGTVSGLTLSGTVTSSGNLTLGGTLSVAPSNFASQTANTFLAAPNGTAGVPTFRTIVAADVPTLNQNTTGQAGSVAQSVTFNNAGSGAASGTTYNGSTARTISHNTIGALALTGGTLTGNLTISNATSTLSFSSTTGNKTITTGGNTHLILAPGGTGNVGIGTTSPQKILDVVNPANDFVSVGTAQMATGQWTGIHFGYREANTLYRKSAIVFERIDGSARGKIHILNNDVAGTNSATLSDARLTITSSGNVGIGTTSPNSKLEVFGSGSTVVDIQGSSGQLFSVTDSLTGTVFSVNDISGIPIIEAIAATTNVVEVTGEIRASGEITAFFSDERLKTKVGNIDNPLEIVKSLSAFKYVNNQKANDFGYHDTKVHVGLSAQQVQSVVPEVVSLAPFDTIKDGDGNNISRTGENYLTMDYAKLVPVLIEAIKEQQNQIDELKKLLEEK